MLHTEKGVTLKYQYVISREEISQIYIVCNIENMGGPGDKAKIIGHRATTHTKVALNRAGTQ